MTGLNRQVLEEILDAANADLVAKGSPFKISIAATEKDLDEGQKVVTDAFMHYAMFKWMIEQVQDETERRAIVQFFVRAIQRICFLKGVVLLVRDTTTDNVVGSAHINYIDPNTSWPKFIFSAFHLVGSMLFQVLFGAIGFPTFFFRPSRGQLRKRSIVLQKLDDEHEKVLPSSTEHLHLIQLATDPTQQSGGVGTILLNVLSSLENRLQLASYLETDTLRLRAYYEKNGYKVETEYVIEDGSDNPFQPNFGMVRRPAQ